MVNPTFPLLSIDHMRDRYFSPLVSALAAVEATFGHSCRALFDRDWLQQGCLRVLSAETSGRGHLQRLVDTGILSVLRQTLQASLHSERRLSLVTAVNHNLLRRLSDAVPDPFAAITALRDYDVYAADGHFHAHATHDVAIGGSKRAVQHFYALNLRNKALSHLTVAESGGEHERKREHDMRALKRMTIEQLRQCAPVGRKVIYIYDRAAVDFCQWTTWKRQGIYFISREKSLHRLHVYSTHPDYNPDDHLNHGVINDEVVASPSSAAIRRITYQNPENGEIMTFLTNLFDNVPAGVIAYLYKRRWDIEKLFDTIKHSYHEQKAWASSDTAKTIQSEFICLQHNLACLFEQHFDFQQIEEPHRQRAQNRLTALAKKVSRRSASPNQLSLMLTTISYVTQHPLRYLRWLRVSLENNLLLSKATGVLESHTRLNL